MKLKNISLKEVTTLIKRGVSPKYIEEKETAYAILNQKCIRNNFIDKEFQKYSSKDKKYPEEKFIKKYDILINSTGTGTLGRTAIYKFEETSLVDTHITIVRPDKNKIDPVYLGYLISYLEPQITNLGKGATNQIELASKDLEELKILIIPFLETQNKIANILSKYNDLIENNLKRIELLEEAAQRIYKEWFIDFKFPGYEKVKVENGIPEGWEIKNYGTLFPIITGKKNANISKENGKYPFFTCSQNIIYTDDFSFEGNAILLAGNGEFNVKYYRGQFEAYQRTYVLMPYIDELFFYIYQHLKTILYKITKGSKGAVIKYLTKDMIENIEIKIPNKFILDNYNKIIQKYFYQIENLKAQNQKLIEARDRLLPKLMKGEIEV